MFHTSLDGGVSLMRDRRWLTEHGFPQPWIVFSLLAGLVLGSVIGLFSSLPAGVISFLAGDSELQGFGPALWRGSCFIAAAFLLATSFLGFALLPWLSALRGFLLGCGVSAALQSNGYSGLLTAFVSFGVPALFWLPAFLLAASDGADCSLRLLRCFIIGERRPPEARGEFFSHLAMIIILCILNALYCALLLPVILDVL